MTIQDDYQCMKALQNNTFLFISRKLFQLKWRRMIKVRWFSAYLIHVCTGDLCKFCAEIFHQPL